MIANIYSKHTGHYETALKVKVEVHFLKVVVTMAFLSISVEILLLLGWNGYLLASGKTN